MYRIHFTAADLAGTRVAGSPRPLLEALMAMRLLQERTEPARFDAWRHQVRARLRQPARALFDLVPARGYTPMFLAPNASGTVAEQLDLVRGADPRDIAAEMATFAGLHAVPRWARDLDRDPRAIERLTGMLGEMHTAAVAPYWPQVSAQFTADRSARARQFLDGGIDRLLAGLHPGHIRWRPPVLEVLTVSRRRGELHLGGRGLLLVPTVLGPPAPTVDTAGPQPYVTYPATADTQIGARIIAAMPTGRAPITVPHLAALLGRTRAAILFSIAERPGCTTTELATATRISPSSASEHATVLRAAGLISSARHRQTVLHTLTAAGDSLLAANVPAGAGDE
ncbi:winged helix-turn-helix domain-containing protein [Actinoplanes sp. NPDC051513]|uniref:winged helix-turn-helix domain-containing protein n=1 Tax=Actinoplanes sp. NPDC051513 TaxID=3363908 RepID=UPI0037AD90C6